MLREIIERNNKKDLLLQKRLDFYAKLRGEQGPMPELGKDYKVPTAQEVAQELFKLLLPEVEKLKPIAGVDYPIPKDGENGKSIKGKRGPIGPVGKSIKGDPGKDGKDGKNGKSIVGSRGLPGKSRKAYNKIIYPSQIIGVIDGSNTRFLLPEAPRFGMELELMLDNTIQEPRQNYNLIGNRVDYTFPPQVGQRHWARIFRP